MLRIRRNGFLKGKERLLSAGSVHAHTQTATMVIRTAESVIEFFSINAKFVEAGIFMVILEKGEC